MVSRPDGTRAGVVPSRTVIEAVANAENVDPRELDPPLYEVIDPEALDALFAAEDGTAPRVVFRYCGYEVTVDRDDSIRLDPRDGR
ncbi:MAG: HalOD1 output domain-containing protein [Haloferacaceae archaeon]